MQKTLLTCFCLLLSIVMQAATIDVKGVVTDAQGLPLPGVTVVVKNENVGMTTDLDGRFSIQVGQGKTLVFSYIGYRTKEIQVADKTLLDIVLEEDNKILDEVVGAVERVSVLPTDVQSGIICRIYTLYLLSVTLW